MSQADAALPADGTRMALHTLDVLAAFFLPITLLRVIARKENCNTFHGSASQDTLKKNTSMPLRLLERKR